MEKNFHKTFIICPVCGSPDRFLEQLGDELKERGLARPEWIFHLDVRQGPVIDPAKQQAIPIGSEVPAYGLMTDICMNCGVVYAVDVTRMDAKQELGPMPPVKLGRGKLPAIFNNPRLS